MSWMKNPLLLCLPEAVNRKLTLLLPEMLAAAEIFPVTSLLLPVPRQFHQHTIKIYLQTRMPASCMTRPMNC